MSTKCSIYYDSKTHIYQECFDENNIYIDIDADNVSTHIKLGLREILTILKCLNYEKLKKQAFITNEQIEKYCKSCIESRQQEKNNISMMFGDMIFGHPDLPIQEQIANGIKFYTKKRDSLQKVVELVESSSCRWGFYTDLNDILS